MFVEFAICTEAKRGDGKSWGWDVVEAAPHFDGRGGAIDFAI